MSVGGDPREAGTGLGLRVGRAPISCMCGQLNCQVKRGWSKPQAHRRGTTQTRLCPVVQPSCPHPQAWPKQSHLPESL